MSDNENLDCLSVKLLKRLLDAKNVSYSDCIEKVQLIQRVLDSGALATDVDIAAIKEHEKLTLQRHSTWKKHPEYSETAASHLIYFHSSYRASCDELLKLAKDMDPANTKTLGKLTQKFKSMNQFLHAHHSIEENYMFPKMKEKFGTKIDGLADQHEEMRQLEENVMTWLTQLKQSPSAAVLSGLKADLFRFVELLLRHLNEEEFHTMPDLLKIRNFEAL